MGFWSDGNMVNGIFSRWDFFQVGNRNAPVFIYICVLRKKLFYFSICLLSDYLTHHDMRLQRPICLEGNQRMHFFALNFCAKMLQARKMSNTI